MTMETSQADPTVVVEPTKQPLWKRISLIVAEVALVLVLLGLIAAILLPVFYGATPGTADRPTPMRRR
jgi:hypothetical protein